MSLTLNKNSETIYRAATKRTKVGCESKAKVYASPPEEQFCLSNDPKLSHEADKNLKTRLLKIKLTKKLIFIHTEKRVQPRREPQTSGCQGNRATSRSNEKESRK